MRTPKRLAAPIDYLLAILSPLDVAQAVCRYVERQPTESLLLHVRRCIGRMKEAERGEFARAFGIAVKRDDNPLFDHSSPMETELVTLAEASKSQLHERFVLFLQRNPRALTTFDSEAIEEVFRPLVLGARSQMDDTTSPDDCITCDEMGRSFSALSSVHLAALRRRVLAVLIPSKDVAYRVVAGVLVAVYIAVPSRIATDHHIALLSPRHAPRIAVSPRVIRHTVAPATEKTIHAPVRVAAIPARPTPMPDVHRANTPKPATLDTRLAAEATSSSSLHLPDVISTSAQSITRRFGPAPADESFGHLNQTVLGIRNQLDAFDATSDTDMRESVVASKLDELQDELVAWQRKYPNDPWLPPSLLRLIKDYDRAGEEASPQATEVLHIMQSAYPHALDAQTTTTS